MDLPEFLLACITEDEEVAQRALATHVSPLSGATLTDWEIQEWEAIWGDPLAHVERWDPARVLAECAAKRAIVEMHRHEAKGPGPVLYDGSRDLNEGVFGCVICSCVTDDPGWHFTGGWCQTVRLLALPYADCEGYDEAWRPESPITS